MKINSYKSQVTWIAALGWIVAAQAQDILKPEFTPKCNECIYKLNWHSTDSDGAYYELFIVDPVHPEGRRRIYKGASGEAFVTVSGPQTAEVRACYYEISCSAFTEIPLVPQTKPANKQQLDKLRITSPIELIHRSSSDAVIPSIGRRVYGVQSVLLDISATGQRGCNNGAGRRVWNIGTRMTITLAPDLVFNVSNRSIVEHDDGLWTWTGDIVDDHDGTVTLTANDCKESAYVSIESDSGNFAIQPTTAPEHVAYGVDATPGSYDCSQPIHEETSPLIEFVDAPGGHDPGLVQNFGVRFRYVNLDFDEFSKRFAPLAYIVGKDRDHEISNFLVTLSMFEFFPSFETKFDFRHGDFVSDSAASWRWSGCIAGDEKSRLHLSVDNRNRSVNLRAVRGNRVTTLRPTLDGRYLIVERESTAQR